MTNYRLALTNASIVGSCCAVGWPFFRSDYGYSTAFADFYDALDALRDAIYDRELLLIDRFVTVPLVVNHYFFYTLLAVVSVFLASLCLSARLKGAASVSRSFAWHVLLLILSVLFFSALFAGAVAFRPILSGCRSSSGQGWAQDIYRDGCLAELDPLAALLVTPFLLSIHPLTWICFLAVCIPGSGALAKLSRWTTSVSRLLSLLGFKH
jgi:hypothetical protein